MTAETETIARILANGFNEHTRRHGPDGDHAGEAVEDGDGFDGLIVMRQGAQYAVRVERLPAESAPPSLAERVTTCLLGAGFRERADATVPITQPSFGVIRAAGTEVEVALWWAALNGWRGKVLAKYAAALRAGGFTVAERDGHLYVPEPKQAGQEAATAAGEGNQ